jgi:glucose/arabinose dehydrogenase
VVEQAGLVRIVEDGSVRPEPFLDLRALVRTSPKGAAASEEGLLSIAFADGYADSGRFFVAYTDRSGRLVVAAYPAPVRTLLLVEKDEPRHMGGQVRVGPDGALYASVGDDSLTYEHAQRLAGGDVRGKLLRLGERGWEVVAYGLRNPWRFSFDPVTGKLWVGDVGEAAWEEVSTLDPERAEPANLGWPAFEGYEAADGALEGPGELVWPAAVYPHEHGCAVVGGHVYRGAAVPSLAGRYLHGDFCTGAVWSLDPSNPGDVRLELRLGTTLASFGEDLAGELYLVSRTGTIFRLEAG